MIYGVAFILAYCSIVYELLMAQSLTLLTGDSALRYSTTIGLYLASMGLGAFMCRGKRLARAIETLLKAEILLSIVGGAAVVLLYFSHGIYSYLLMTAKPESVSLGLFFTVSYGIIALIGVLTGFELPLLIHIREQEKKKTANLVLGVDYLGSLAGAILFPLVLLPHLGVLKIGFVTAMLNVLAALMLLVYKGAGVRRSRAIFAVPNGIILCAIIFVLSFSSDVTQYCLKRYYYFQESSVSARMLFSSMKTFPRVERFRSPYQNIDIVDRASLDIYNLIFSRYSKKYVEDPESPRDHWLFLNGDCQIFSGVEELYHEYMVHVPIIAHQVPKKVLVLGGGDGLLNRELLKYRGIESITHVDIDPEMINLAKNHPIMKRLNGNSLIDPRVSIKLMDAFSFLRTTTEKYDAIFIDFPVAKDYNLSKLYSREFYSFVRNHLASDGFAVLDATWSLMEEWLIYYHTIKAAGFRTIIPFTSALEIDNPEIKELNIAWEYIFGFVDSLRQGFIMMRKSAGNLNMRYKDNGVKMYVLNEKRYKLAFSLPYPKPEEIDWGKVNSIMRPTLPDLSFWNVRLPY